MNDFTYTLPEPTFTAWCHGSTVFRYVDGELVVDEERSTPSTFTPVGVKCDVPGALCCGPGSGRE